MNGVDLLTRLCQTLPRIALRWPISEIEVLVPLNFKPNAIG
jgi:transposase